jgi:hypothetical protein
VFDGIDDYSPLSGLISLGNTFTIISWIKLSVVGGTYNVYGCVANGSDNWFGVAGSVVNFRGTEIADVNNFDLNGVTSLSIGVWYQISVTVNVSTVTVYLNGVVENSVVKSFIIASWNSNGGNDIGRRGGINSNFFNGNILSIIGYNRVLSVAEILQNYYAGLDRLIPTDNLVLWLDGTNTNTRVITPTTAYDRSGNNYNGSFVNGTTLAHRDGGTVFNFDGVDDKLTTTLSTLTSSSTWTIWVKRTQSMNFYNMFMSMGSIFFAYRSDGVIQYSNLIGSVQQDVFASPSLVDNVWYSFAFVSSYSAGNTTMEIYVNGVLQTQSTFAGQQSITSPLIFGDWGFASYPFKGKIGDVRVYSRALTTTELSTIYTAGRLRYGL